jgi:hypothetical protein
MSLKQDSKTRRTKLLAEIDDVNLALEPILDRTEAEIKLLRERPYRTVLQRENYTRSLSRTVARMVRDYKRILGATLQRTYLRTLNENVKGAIEEKGKAVQKETFSKTTVPKELDQETVWLRFAEVARSIISYELEFKKRELAIFNLLSANAD